MAPQRQDGSETIFTGTNRNSKKKQNIEAGLK